jgi:hypothetical protein
VRKRRFFEGNNPLYLQVPFCEILPKSIEVGLHFFVEIKILVMSPLTKPIGGFTDARRFAHRRDGSSFGFLPLVLEPEAD